MKKCLRYLSSNSNQAGFTLVEILVSLILISLICVSIFPIFANRFKGITVSAENSKENYESQKAMENILAGESYSEIAGSTQTYSPISISFPGVTEMVVEGDVVATPITYNSKVDHLTSFIPHNSK
jgi:prepilin-type N-terminal cleavage/methylation domain-containing protein